ncbi:MAG: NAD(P)H-binding protein [Alphaproteobacteria bacterium]|nr:NAD(P)H-binding protein [Alphaproteobacteria bacterium]
MTIAVTGATGFVGQALLDASVRARVPLRALTRRPQDKRDGVEWVAGGLSDRDALNELVAGVSALIHVAGLTNTPDPRQFEQANVAGTLALLDAAREAGAGRFVFVSSLSAREPALSAYGASKARAEEHVTASGLDWTVVRPPAVYGPRDRDMFELFRSARLGVVPLPPRGRTSLIHVDDLAECLLALVPGGEGVRSACFEPDDGRGGGYGHDEMARMIGAAVGRRVWTPHLPKPLLKIAARGDRLLRGDAAKLTADRVGYMTHPDWVSRLTHAVPPELWRPRIAGAEGLASTAQWYRDAGWL